MKECTTCGRTIPFYQNESICEVCAARYDYMEVCGKYIAGKISKDLYEHYSDKFVRVLKKHGVTI